jgi:hypothetical protein
MTKPLYNKKNTLKREGFVAKNNTNLSTVPGFIYMFVMCVLSLPKRVPKKKKGF